jgi:hypothetical protein
MLANVGVLLEAPLAYNANISTMKLGLTSCSDNGTFLSFILWTPALAEPSSVAAATADVYFMLKKLG